MAPLRLRHPGGVSTIDVNFDDSFTVQDLQQHIYAVSQILPSLQDLKSGYPPQSLTIVPELPFSSLGIQKGDQIIVGQKAEAASRRPSSPPKPYAASGLGPTSGSASIPGGFSTGAPVASVATPSTTGGIGTSKEPDAVQMDGGFLVHRIVPDDNSCLFSSVALIFEQDIGKAPRLRQIVADSIRNDMVTYSEAILGRPRDEYIATILKPETWGGAIELAILSAHYKTEISSIDVETGRIDRFEPPSGTESGNRCILVYSGIHYDAATLSPTKDAPPDFHQTVFPIMSGDKSDPALVAAQKLADILRQKRAFTNISTFDLKCLDCGQGLVGEKGARAHAKETGHLKFGEY
jgi:ubiquitin thioesterase OTU1